MTKKLAAVLAAGVAAGTAALLSLPAGAGAHATVTPFQPQTAPLTAARTLYVLRVPNEDDAKSTYRVSLYVPEPLQEAISIKQTADWRVKLRRRFTGEVNEGSRVYAISKITWIARKGSKIKPGFFGDFFLRFQNPVQAQQLCFPVLQYYKRGNSKRERPEVVRWTGPPDAEFPASCVTTVAAPPAA